MRAAIGGHSFFCKLWGLLQGEGGGRAETDLRHQPGGPHPLPATPTPPSSEEAPGGGSFQVSQPRWVCPSSISLSRVRPFEVRGGRGGEGRLGEGRLLSPRLLCSLSQAGNSSRTSTCHSVRRITVHTCN